MNGDPVFFVDSLSGGYLQNIVEGHLTLIVAVDLELATRFLTLCRKRRADYPTSIRPYQAANTKRLLNEFFAFGTVQVHVITEVLDDGIGFTCVSITEFCSWFAEPEYGFGKSRLHCSIAEMFGKARP